MTPGAANNADVRARIRDLGRAADNLERAFLAGVEQNLKPVLGTGDLPGTRAQLQRRDQASQLREEMFRRGLGDPQVFADLPLSRSLSWTLTRPRVGLLPWLFRRTSAVAVAATWHDVDALLSGEPGRPATAEQVRELARAVLPTAPPGVPVVLAVGSTSGFSDEVRAAGVDLPGVKLVLVEPQAGGERWTVTAPRGDVPAAVLRALDPETDAGKIERVRQAVQGSVARLSGSGVSAGRVARELAVPPALVHAVFAQLRAADPALRTLDADGDMLLLRGVPAAQEGGNMLSWLKGLLGSKDTPAAKINQLKERRAVLSAQRDRLYDEIAQLETRESELKQEGITNENQLVRRRVAGQLAGVRKDIARQNASVTLLSAQIEQLSTHLHNLELVQQGQSAGLPTADEMQSQAAQAEELFADVAAKREIAGALDVGLDAALTSPEEADILREFEQGAQAQKASPAGASAATTGPVAARPVPAGFEPSATPPAATPPEREAGKQRA